MAPQTDPPPTSVDARVTRWKNNPTISIIILVGLVIIALGTFTDALTKIVSGFSSIWTPRKEESARITRLDAETIARLRALTSVAIEHVQPSSTTTTIDLKHEFVVTCIVTYAVPEELRGAEVDIRWNTEPEREAWSVIATNRTSALAGRLSLAGIVYPPRNLGIMPSKFKLEATVSLFDQALGSTHHVTESEPISFDTGVGQDGQLPRPNEPKPMNVPATESQVGPSSPATVSPTVSPTEQRTSISPSAGDGVQELGLSFDETEGAYFHHYDKRTGRTQTFINSCDNKRVHWRVAVTEAKRRPGSDDVLLIFHSPRKKSYARRLFTSASFPATFAVQLFALPEGAIVTIHGIIRGTHVEADSLDREPLP